MFISGKEAKMYFNKIGILHGQYKVLEAQLRGHMPTASIPPPIEVDIHMRAMPSEGSDGADS